MSTSQQNKRTSTEDKFKALQEIESGQPKSLGGYIGNTEDAEIFEDESDEMESTERERERNQARKHYSRQRTWLRVLLFFKTMISLNK